MAMKLKTVIETARFPARDPESTGRGRVDLQAERGRAQGQGLRLRAVSWANAAPAGRLYELNTRCLRPFLASSTPSVLVLHARRFARPLLLLAPPTSGHTSATTTKHTWQETIGLSRQQVLYYFFLWSGAIPRIPPPPVPLPGPAPRPPFCCCRFCWAPPRPRPLDTTSSFTMSMISSGMRRYLMVLPRM